MRSPSPSTVIAWLVLAVGLGLAAAVLSLPAGPTDLRARVDAALGDSGVAHPVTAVLLNYRSYDTLLELGVLLLALAGTWSFCLAAPREREPAGPLQVALVRTLIPVMILVAGHLLWLGSEAPGGAFQAGAVLGAAGVLLLLSWPPLPVRTSAGRTRALASLGLLVFLAVGLGTLHGGLLLEYRGPQASRLIFVIEAAASLSIGAILAALFAAAEERL